MSGIRDKHQRIEQAKTRLLTAPNGLTDQELANTLGVDRMSAYRYRTALGATAVTHGRYTLLPSQEDIELARTILEKASADGGETMLPETQRNGTKVTHISFPLNGEPIKIAIGNEKGGTGKTTFSINLAAGMALKNRNVLVIDLDPQGNATQGLGARRAPRLYDLLVRDTDWSDSIVQIGPEKYVPTGYGQPYGNLYLLPGHVETKNLPTDIPANLLRQRIASLAGVVDLVIIDTAPTVTETSTFAYITSDVILVATQLAAWSMAGIQGTLKRMADNQINRQQLTLPPLDILGIIPNMVSNGTEYDANLTDLQAAFGDKVWPGMRRRQIWDICARQGHTIFAHETTTSDLQKALGDIGALVDRMQSELYHVPA